MACDTPAQLSFEIVRRIAVLARTDATIEAGGHARHVASGHVLEFGEGVPWSATEKTELAASPADLSQALLSALFGLRQDQPHGPP